MDLAIILGEKVHSSNFNSSVVFVGLDLVVCFVDCFCRYSDYILWSAFMGDFDKS